MKELLEYLGVRMLEGAFSALPRRAAGSVGRGLGRAAYAAGVRRRLVEGHIRRAFPDRDDDWIERTALGCYRHFGAELASLARMARAARTARTARTPLTTRTDDRTRADGAGSRGGGDRLVERTAGGDRFREVWTEATAGTGRGALVVTGHLGNWELAGAAAAGLGIPVSAVVKGQRNQRVDRHLAAVRRSLGVEPIAMRWAGRGVPKALDAGRAVALVADQDARDRGVVVPFLGRPASTFRGPAALALRHDVPLLFGTMVREGEGWRLGLEPVEAESSRPTDEGSVPATDDGSVRALTRAWVAKLEREVRERPEQYFWFHRRWKSAPAEEGAVRIRAAPDG